MNQLEKVEQVRAGQWRNIDDYVQELRDAGFEADYENVWSCTSGFTAILRVEDEDHAVWEGNMHGHMVKEKKKSLSEVME